MSPPLTIALMQSRPLLNPHPKTIVAALLISNPIYYKCRISDHLHLVFQWGIHTAVFLKKQIACFENAYTSAATIRILRKHEGHPARAPDGTIMEIYGEACPGDSGESVGPWDLENVHLCEGFSDWSAALSRNLQMAVADGYNINTVNEPKPSREDLDKANVVDGQWLNGKPLHSYSKKILTMQRDGIRDKLGAFLLFVAEKVKSEARKEGVLETLRQALEAALAGKPVGEYNGILGGMINKITARVEEFIRYLEDKAESRDARDQRVDELREIIETALRGSEKRKRDDDGVVGGQERKKVMTEDVRKATEKNLTQELTLGAPLSRSEQDARLSRARMREARKQKEKEAAANNNNNKDKRASYDKVSTQTAYEKPDAYRPEQLNTADLNTESSSRRSSTETGTSTAYSKEADSYADKGTSPRTPAVHPRLRPRPRPALEPAFDKPESPPPPYTESPLFDAYSNSVSPALQSPQQGSIFSTPQMTETSNSSRVTTPGHGVPRQQLVKQKHMTPAQRILDQIHNPGKRYRESMSNGSSPQAQPSAVRNSSSKFMRQSTSALPATSETATQTDREVSPAYDEEESAPVLPNRRPESIHTSRAPKTSASLSPLSRSLSLSPSSLAIQTSHPPTKIPAVEPEAEPEPEAEVEASQEEADEEESLFLPLAQCTTEPAPRVAPSSVLSHASAPVSEPEQAPTRKLAAERTPQASPQPAFTPRQASTSIPPSPLHPLSPILRESSPDSDSDSDLPPPPTKHLFGSSKAPIVIDLDDPHYNPYSSSQNHIRNPSSNSRIPTPLIKAEPPASSNYILIKDEDEDEDEDSDSTPDSKAAVKRELARAEVKGRIKARVKREEVEEDDIIEVWDSEVWEREVKEKNRKALEKAREARGW
ncbi:hypothetical protein VTL71DRAFT_3493 [Oculimacula yallundae]|uniref:Uncharacterized protein n=1 Tax=Oculimacula yallundae TaxID=86028 RepID=A0ABR4C7A7_9HELO